MARDEAYYKAEKKIEEAQRRGAKELELNLARLTKLPSSLSENQVFY